MCCCIEMSVLLCASIPVSFLLLLAALALACAASAVRAGGAERLTLRALARGSFLATAACAGQTRVFALATGRRRTWDGTRP